jgi:uncharacterized membrane protein
MAQPTQINDSGEVAGLNGSNRADYWQNGVVNNLPVASGYINAGVARGINSSGMIVGTEENSSNRSRCYFRYRAQSQFSVASLCV